MMNSNKERMGLLENRIVKKRSLFKRYMLLVGSLAVIVIAFIIIETNLSLPDQSNDSPAKYHVVDGLTIEEGAQISISKKAKLLGSSGTTIGLIHLPLMPNQDYTGYLGIWDTKGKLIQKFDVTGYNIMNPIQIHVLDLTGDGNPDIVLETDERANGGLGVIVAHIYVENNGQYTEAPLSEELHTSFTTTFRSSSQDFMMVSAQDNRRWTVQWTTDQLKELDSNLLNQSNPVKVDPISSLDLKNNSLKTKRLIWFGNLQLNSLAILVTSYHFENNKWAMQRYSLADIDKSTIVTEIK